MIELALIPWVLALIGYLILRGDRIDQGGLYFWQRRWLFANGAHASGLVLDHAEHSPGWSGRFRSHTVDLVIEFSPEGARPVRIPLSYRLIDGATSNCTEAGETVPIRYDPRQPTRAAIDWPSIGGGTPRDRSDEQRDADRARQAALLRGDKR
jgi:hypothetical protein